MDAFEAVFPSCQGEMHVYGGTSTHQSFPIHQDLANNFIIQCEGETHWTVYNDRAAIYSHIVRLWMQNSAKNCSQLPSIALLKR